MSKPFKFPTTLKECLQLVGKLIRLEETSEWSALLEKRVKVYVLKYTFNDLRDTVYKISSLHGTILQDDYGEYNNLTVQHLPVQSIVDAMAVAIPQVLSALLFLQFQLSKTYKTLGGGTWENVTDTNNKLNEQLKNWFMDSGSQPKGIMKRGFTLNDFTGKKLETDENLKELITCFNKNLPFCNIASQGGLFFITTSWNDSYLANAVIFLKVFCDEIISGQFNQHFRRHYNEMDYVIFQDVCASVFDNLESLTNVLTAMYNNADSVYEERLSYQSPYLFLSWIDNNVQNVIRSLKKMGTDSLRWNKDSFKNATSAGPFKYGFVFKGNKWDDIDRQSLQLTIYSLTSPAASEYEAESLHDLLSFANRVHAPKVTTSGAVTGLVSTASLIGAATYALNIIGMADTAKSFIEFPDTVGELVTPAFNYAKQMLTKGL